MRERERITITQKESEKNIDKNDILNIAENLIKKAANDPLKYISAINQICDHLIDNDATTQNIIIEELSNKQNIKKSILKDRLKELKRLRKIEEKKKDQDEFLTRIDKQEAFLAENYIIKYNEISNEVEIKDIITGEEGLNELDILRKMKKNNISCSENELRQILGSNYVEHYNPIKDYFINLKTYDPNKDPDYINKLMYYLNVEDTERFKIQFRKHLVRTIACAFEKDLNKQALILVGDGEYNQNSGKTTFIRWLVPDVLKDYYTEDLEQSKDGLIALASNFIINFDELEGFTKAEISKLKSYLSKESINVRLPFGKRQKRIPRRASFYGSTNEVNFLTDLTGNVRWLVFKLKPVVEPINWNYKKDIDINDIWRQAYYLFKNNFNYKLSREEIKENEKANNDFLILPPEYDILLTNYEKGTEDDHDVFYTTADFLKSINEINPQLKLNSIRLGKVLRKLGYIRRSKRDDENKSIKGYYIKFNYRYHPPSTRKELLEQRALGELSAPF